MYILGLQFSYFHDTAACLIKDGKMIGFIEEERLNRQKHTREIPLKSINYLCQNEGISIQQIDCLAINFKYSWSTFWNRISYAFELAGYNPFTGAIISLKALYQHLRGFYRLNNAIKRFRKDYQYQGKIIFVDHHTAHLCCAFYVWNCLMGYPRSCVLESAFWGPNFTKEEIKHLLDNFKLDYNYLDNPAKIEKTAEYFEDDYPVLFMEKVYKIKPEKRQFIPAVVYIDGTGRLHTVRKNDNPLYWQLIKEFENITGIPIVLNTSFNVKGEPIVCSPEDALKCFFSTGMDYLLIGNFLVRKK